MFIFIQSLFFTVYSLSRDIIGPNKVVSRDIPMETESEIWKKLEYNGKKENIKIRLGSDTLECPWIQPR